MSHNAAECNVVQQLVNLEMGESYLGDSEDEKSRFTIKSGMVCSSCFNTFEEESFDHEGMETSETLREIRKLRLEQECGTDLNYRCVRCRDCSACKDSDRTEAVSLREEAEMEEVIAQKKFLLLSKIYRSLSN